VKPYGLKRTLDVEFPDAADLHIYALKSKIGNLKEKCGVYRGTIKNKTNKRSTRRYFKRLERAMAKRAIRKELQNDNIEM